MLGDKVSSQIQEPTSFIYDSQFGWDFILLKQGDDLTRCIWEEKNNAHILLSMKRGNFPK